MAGAGERRELDGRVGDGIDVRLLWHPRTGNVSVAVADVRTGESFEFGVPGPDAREAFKHPYAYAHNAGRMTVEAITQAGASAE